MSKDWDSMTEAERDAIINPKHYEVLPNYEYMQIMEHVLGKGVVPHLLGQMFKYMFRLGKKDNFSQDLSKVLWYGQYLLDYIERSKQGMTPYKP